MTTKKRLVVFKKGLCKEHDAQRVRDKSLINLKAYVTAICDDWGIDEIPFLSFCNRFSAAYYGEYVHETVKVSKMFGSLTGVKERKQVSITNHKIYINTYAWSDCFKVKSGTEFKDRAKLLETIRHETAHYIQMKMYKYTGHDSLFRETLEAIDAKADEYAKVLI